MTQAFDCSLCRFLAFHVLVLLNSYSSLGSSSSFSFYFLFISIMFLQFVHVVSFYSYCESQLSLSQRRYVIIIDALDESGSRCSELTLVLVSGVKHLPSCFGVLFTSRPEVHHSLACLDSVSHQCYSQQQIGESNLKCKTLMIA
jgi:hypothetical protein